MVYLVYSVGLVCLVPMSEKDMTDPRTSQLELTRKKHHPTLPY